MWPFTKKVKTFLHEDFAGWIHKERGKVSFTPDINLLQQKKLHWLFVCDEMMKHHVCNLLLSENTLRCTAFTAGTYTLWKMREKKDFIKIIPLSEGPACKSVKGELYLVPSETLISIDKYKKNGVQFRRRKIHINIPYRKEIWSDVYPKKRVLEKNLATLKAWMYEGITEFWEPLLDGGFTFKEVRSFIPKNDLLEEYYYFTTEEYKSDRSKFE